MFKRVLIANRGEIAVRIIRACEELDIETVAIFSEADENALHVQLADHAVCVGSADATDSYLNKDSILRAALETGADAIHPGYGFLSENAQLAKRCEEEGIIFKTLCNPVEIHANDEGLSSPSPALRWSWASRMLPAAAAPSKRRAASSSWMWTRSL